MITAYTHSYVSIQSQVLVDCQISLPNSDPAEGSGQKALWDTGAMVTCISTELAARLGLLAVDETMIVGANNEPFKVPTYCVQVKMGSFVIPIHTVVGLPMEGNGHSIIIGMDIISKGDLSITNYSGRTVISFRTPSLEVIDYVGEIELQNKCNKIHDINERAKRADKCACGSGKDYKNCHGNSIYVRRKG